MKDYKSVSDKKKFRKLTITLNSIAVLIQIVLQVFLFIFFLFFVFNKLDEMSCNYVFDRGVFWNEHFYFQKEKYVNLNEQENFKYSIHKLNVNSEIEKEISKLNIDEKCWFLPDTSCLWIISSTKTIKLFKNGETKVFSNTIGLTSQPFFYNKLPSMVEFIENTFYIKSFSQGVWSISEEIPVTFENDFVFNKQDFRYLIFEKQHMVISCVNDELYYSIFNYTKKQLDNNNIIFNKIFKINGPWDADISNNTPLLLARKQGKRIEPPSCFKYGNYGKSWYKTYKYSSNHAIDIGMTSYSKDNSQVLMLDNSIDGKKHFVYLDKLGHFKKQREIRAFTYFQSIFLLMLVLIAVFSIIPFIYSILITLLMKSYRVSTFMISDRVQVEFASVRRRALAQIIDVIIVGTFVSISFYLLHVMPIFLGILEFIMLFTIPFIPLIAYSWLEGFYGLTPGKWIFKIRVVNEKQYYCGFWKALIRNIVRIVDAILGYLIGMIIIAYSEKWQRLGDKLAGTIVIKKNNTINKDMSEPF